MILHIATERNRNDLEWLQKTVRMEQVIYDKRQNNLDQFIKTEIRKYATFSHLILDSNIFDDTSEDIEEFIRSISYLCSAYIGIVGNEITATDIAGVSWFADSDDMDDRQQLMRWIIKTDVNDTLEEKETEKYNTDYDINEKNQIVQERKTVRFYKKLGMTILFAGIDEYTPRLAIGLANALASWGAAVSYSMLSQNEHCLQQLAEEHKDFYEIDGGYCSNGVEYYLNAANDAAHFIIFDLEKPKIDFIKKSQADKIYYYSRKGLPAIEPLTEVLNQTESNAEVLLFNISEEEQEVFRQQLRDYSVKIHFLAFDQVVEDCFNQQALKEMPLNQFFIIGEKII